VQLGLLGREYLGIAAVCGLATPAAAPTVAEVGATAIQRAAVNDRGLATDPLAALAWFTSGLGGWLPALALLALLATMAALIAFAVADWRSYQHRGTRKGYRPRRTAHERFAPSVELQRRATTEAGQLPEADRRSPEDDDEDDLLRQLLGQ
jgi:hypothetical protein